MNKKINLLLVGLLVFCISFISVQAKATYPKSNPTVNKDLYVEDKVPPFTNRSISHNEFDETTVETLRATVNVSVVLRLSVIINSTELSAPLNPGIPLTVVKLERIIVV